MAIVYPLSLPTVRSPRRITFEPVSVVGVSMSPFTFGQVTFEHPGGEMWSGSFELGELNRDEGEEYAAFLTALRGRAGTFLLGDPLGVAPRGTWVAPLVNGAAQSGYVMNVDGLSAGATGKKGDWFQIGSGAATQLYKLMLDFTANGSGQASIDFWPALRSAPADNAALTLASAKGLMRLAQNKRGWTLQDVRFGGIQVDFHEAL